MTTQDILDQHQAMIDDARTKFIFSRGKKRMYASRWYEHCIDVSENFNRVVFELDINALEAETHGLVKVIR